MVELIDLSGYVEEDQPVFPGHERTQFWTTHFHEEQAYTLSKQLGKETATIKRKLGAKRAGDDEENPLVRTLLVSEHGPTHVDALCHIDPTREESIEKMSLDWFYGDAVGIDVSHVSSDEFITPDDLETGLAEHGLEIQDGDAITLHTGHRQEHYGVEDHEQRYAYQYEYTGLTGEAATWLADRGVKNIGIDAPSIDHGTASSTAEFPAHDVCAEREMINIENMANLDTVVGERFTLCAFPLKLRDGTGSPIRPVAILE